MTTAPQGLESIAAANTDAGNPERPRRGAYYALGVLSIVALFSQLDRQLTAIIVGPLKAEFAISDTMFSLLHGYSFALPYALLGLPFGRLVDRYNRRNIVAIGLIAWSSLTLASAFAGNFWQLVFFRAGVGIGEAVLAPAAYSLLADFFHARKRGRAVSIYYLSMSAGAGISLVLGGLLLQFIPKAGFEIAGLITLSPWRMLFLLTGLPGLFAAMLLLTFREPARARRESDAHATFRDFGKFVLANRSTLWRISALSVLMNLVGYSAAGWAPALLERQFGEGPAHTALPLGLATILSSILGPLASGWISDHWISRGDAGARTRVMLIGYILLMPAAFWSLAPSLPVAIFLYGLMVFAVSIVQCAMPVALQEAAPPHMVGQITALQITILGLLSVGLGPTAVALVTDHVFHSDAMLKWSMVVVLVPATLLGLAISINTARRKHVAASF